MEVNTNKNEETIIALLKQKLDAVEKKLDLLVGKFDEFLDTALSKEDAAAIYATKLEMERIRNRQNFYAWVVPVLTSIVGFLSAFLMTKLF